jgi:hypothetical protein
MLGQPGCSCQTPPRLKNASAVNVKKLSVFESQIDKAIRAKRSPDVAAGYEDALGHRRCRGIAILMLELMNEIGLPMRANIFNSVWPSSVRDPREDGEHEQAFLGRGMAVTT